MPIRAYLRYYLTPRLARLGLSDAPLQRVARDVGQRLASALCRWNDRRFRDTVLILGEEEATFWMPDDVDLATRSLVVVGVRNSLIEDLASTPEAARRLGLRGPVLSDDEMAKLTDEAIRFFGNLDLDVARPMIAAPPPSQDIFGNLPAQYPVTWRALGELAHLADGDSSFTPVPAEPPSLPIGRPAELTLRGREGPRVLSGMATEIEPELRRMLRLVRTDIYPGIFSNSFKTITRNPRKLFAVMEFVLAHRRAVVTQNYYIRNGYVARRTPLLRPAHTATDARVKFFDSGGLLPGHAEAIARFAPARL